MALDGVADCALQRGCADLAFDEEVGRAGTSGFVVDLAIVLAGEQDDRHLVPVGDQLTGEIDSVLRAA